MPDTSKQSEPGVAPAAASEKGGGKASRPWPDLWGHLLFWPLAAAGLTADLWTKAAVHDWLRTLPGQTYTVVKDYIFLVIRFNRGAAFSMFQGRMSVLVAVSILALVLVLGIFLFGSVRQRALQAALALFTAGILGNLYDRAFGGEGVRDWIEVVIPVVDYRWPAFNIADSLLCIAVGLIVLLSLTSSSSRTPVRPRK